MMSYVKVYKHARAPVDFELVTLDPTQITTMIFWQCYCQREEERVWDKSNMTQMNRPDIKSRNVEMRNELDLYVNRIHCQSQSGIKTRHDDIDVVIMRQNTERVRHVRARECWWSCRESRLLLKSTERL